MNEKVKSYLIEWIKFELEQERIKNLEPELAFSTAYEKLSNLDEISSEFNEEDTDLANLIGDKILKNKNDYDYLVWLLNQIESGKNISSAFAHKYTVSFRTVAETTITSSIQLKFSVESIISIPENNEVAFYDIFGEEWKLAA
ncbi:hypothetical protein LPTSP4_08980 [Leptospira ryugenii]|uniref:PIK helical domain-containing protein n=1 Tax=Leptospira ryugenii TaxID=1917863 RepID=A0A2P2DXM9_9LEPT|nr:hypothetical protein [Leptospira ryugenii]GBF49385.1 hypothetical protein LPTSP4_08980 [Leptospira ryugenii]